MQLTTSQFDDSLADSRRTAHGLRIGCVMLATLFLLAACAGASVDTTETAETGELSKPDQIVVFPFSYRPAQEPDAEGQRELTEQELEIGRQVADLVANSLVDKLNDEIDIVAYAVSSSKPPPGATLAIEGEFLSIDEGSGAARALVGFGAGRSTLTTKAKAFHISSGDRILVSEYELSADSGFMPGLISGAPDGAEGLAVAGAGVALETALGNDTIADAKRTGEELAGELIKVLQEKGWVEAKK